MPDFGPVDVTEATTYRAKCTSADGTVEVFSNPFTVTPDDACPDGPCAIAAQPSPVQAAIGGGISLGGAGTGPIQWQQAPASAGPWADIAEPTVLTAAMVNDFFRFCCVDNPTVCSDAVQITQAPCQITADPANQTGPDGTAIPANMGASASGQIQWQRAPAAVGPWNNAAGPPATVSAANAGFWRACCFENPAVCSAPAEISVVAVGAEFSTAGGQVLTPCGTPFYGMGMNVAVSVTDGPFVFEGIQGGSAGPACNGAVDIWPNDPNNNGCYPGGGVNSRQRFSPQGGGLVQLPDRCYALNGNLTQAAVNHGITQPADNWNQEILRPTFVCQGQPAPPTAATTAVEAVAGIQELVDCGLVVAPELHDITGDNVAPTAAWNAPLSSFSGEFACVVQVVDAIVQAFRTDGNGTGPGSPNVKKGYVWFNPTNEPMTGGAGNGAWQQQAEFWLRRIKNFHNAENIIVLDLDNYGQDLSGLASGEHDAWWNAMTAAGLTDNVVLGWHAYGADPLRNGPYSYANMDADLNAVLRTGTPNGNTYPIMVGEYGQAKVVGGGNAGPDQWNRNAFEYLATNTHGQPLFMKYPETLGMVWHATGDGAFWSSQYTLTNGTGAGDNNGLSQPFWDIQSGADPRLSAQGQAHWDISHQRMALGGQCP